MARISRTPDNIYPVPNSFFIQGKQGYVYVNVSNKYIPKSAKKIAKDSQGYTDHESICIGALVNPEEGKNCQTFYANDNYRMRFLKDELPDPPVFADSLSVGLHEWISKAAADSGLIDDLCEAFDEEEVELILDLASYMMSAESAVMQHYPAWARNHVIFSEKIVDDNAIGRFLKSNITLSKIKLFREKWAVRNIGNGMVMLCYDSTNVNSQARGVFIVQKGHAKDDPTLEQVNTDYVIRQEDGLPLTYLHSPGSVNDIAQAKEMIKFLDEMQEISGKEVELCLVCDRGYISELNVRAMDLSEINYLLMLRANLNLYKDLSDKTIPSLKSYKNELLTQDDSEKYGQTMKCRIYDDGPECYAHIIWSSDLYRSSRKEIKRRITAEREKLEAFINNFSEKAMEPEELKWIPSYFKMCLEPGEPKKVEHKKRGRGTGTVIVEKPTVRLVGYEDDEEKINLEYQKAGVFILVTRQKMTAQEAIDFYAKRDCVEKVFQALKSHLGMDKIGVTTEEAIHGKGLIWFVASILHALMFNGTRNLRVGDRKRYTVPSMVDHLEGLKADKNLRTKKYERRYKLTRHQKVILEKWSIDEQYIDKKIEQISV